MRHSVRQASGDLQLTDAFLAYLRYIGPVGAAFAESVMKQAQPIMEAAEPGEVLAQLLAPEIELFGQTYKRSCTIFSAWKAQRVRDVYNSMPEQDREAGRRDYGADRLGGFSCNFDRRQGRTGWLSLAAFLLADSVPDTLIGAPAEFPATCP